MITDLPPECLSLVMKSLDPSDVRCLGMTCKHMLTLSSQSRTLSPSKYVGTMRGLSFVLAAGCPLCPQLCRCLVAADNDEGLQTVWCLGADMDSSVASEASRSGRLATLAWIVDTGIPIMPDVIDAAAAGGHPNVFRWLYDRGCPMRDATCTRAAARNGRISVLREIARITGRLRCATAAFAEAEAAGRTNVAEWIAENFDIDLVAIRA